MFYIELFDLEQKIFLKKELNMDTMSVFFGIDEIQRLKYSLHNKKEESKKTDVIEMLNSNLYNECEKK